MRLANLGSGRAPATIAVTSGKGGVGKTNVVVNLAVALAGLRKRVLVLDADFGLGNVDVSLGLTPAANLGDVLCGHRSVREALVEGPRGVTILPAGSGLADLTDLTPTQWTRLDTALKTLQTEFDFLLIDTAAGVSSNVIDLLLSSDRVLVVTSPEPCAVVDAYAVIKILHVSSRRSDIGLLVNNVNDSREAELVFQQLDVAARRFLGRRLGSFGFVVHDPEIREAVSTQRAIVSDRPQAAASRCFRRLAMRVVGAKSVGGPGLRLVPRPVDATPAPETEARRCL
jgi:flagellar biosynthesis protein FlhG